MPSIPTSWDCKTDQGKETRKDEELKSWERRNFREKSTGVPMKTPNLGKGRRTCSQIKACDGVGLQEDPRKMDTCPLEFGGWAFDSLHQSSVRGHSLHAQQLQGRCFTGMWVYFHQQHDKNTCAFPNESKGSFWKESDLEENSTREMKGFKRSVKIQKSNGPPASRNQRWGFQPEKEYTSNICSLGTPEPEELCMEEYFIPNPPTVDPARERARNRGCWEKRKNERATSESQIHQPSPPSSP